jgi:hypothetical protein
MQRSPTSFFFFNYQQRITDLTHFSPGVTDCNPQLQADAVLAIRKRTRQEFVHWKAWQKKKKTQSSSV